MAHLTHVRLAGIAHSELIGLTHFIALDRRIDCAFVAGYAPASL
jgi:hypothetical protein